MKMNKLNKTILISLFSALMIIFCFPQETQTIPVRVQWEHDGENSVGYRVYTSANSGGPYTIIGDFPKKVVGTPVEIQLPIGSAIYLVVTAYSEFGIESLPSEPLWIPLFRPNPPTSIFIPAQIIAKGVTISE